MKQRVLSLLGGLLALALGTLLLSLAAPPLPPAAWTMPARQGTALPGQVSTTTARFAPPPARTPAPKRI